MRVVPCFAIAEALLQEGAAVVVNGRTEAKVDAAVQRLRAEAPGSDVFGVAADFADTAKVDRLLGGLGEVDVLVNNLAAQNTTSLLERFIEPSEIAALAVYLASPRSSATNGAALRADGGVLTTTL